jgi:hypothetical protein
MSNESENAMPLSLAKRKERLLREGAMYRAAIERARTVVGHNLHADVLARSVVAQVKSNLFSTLGGLVRLKGSNLQKLLPVAITAISFATKARLVLPLLRAGVVLGAIGVGVSFIARRKRRRQIDSSL